MNVSDQPLPHDGSPVAAQPHVSTMMSDHQPPPGGPVSLHPTDAAPANGAATPSQKSAAPTEFHNDEQQEVNPRTKKISMIIFALFLIVGAALGVRYYIMGIGIEETDDAFTDASVYAIAPKVPGRLIEVPISDNEQVRKGQLLARIDPADYQNRVAQAQAALKLAQALKHEAEIQVGIVDATTAAALAQAQAQSSAAKARLLQANADQDAAKVESVRAQNDFDRYSQLSDRAVSKEKLDEVKSLAESKAAALKAVAARIASAQADIEAADAKVRSAQADRQKVDAARAAVAQFDAQISQAQVTLDQAQLDLANTSIISPADGRVTMKAAEVGNYVQPGQHLLALVAADTYVIANYKETQLTHMEPGQIVSIYIDAYGITVPGHVDSIQAGSGAYFSLLPPQNATGNYVKVVQRVPVKILFDRIPDQQQYLLGPGMSVVPRVRTN